MNFKFVLVLLYKEVKMLGENMLEEYLKYSIEKEAILLIKTIKGSEYPIIVNSFNNEKVFYSFENQTKGQIWIRNIEKFHLERNEDEEEVRYRILSKKYHTNDIKEIIANFKNYYLEILNLLQQEKDEDSQEYKYYDIKKEIYEGMFKAINSDSDNLLLSYFSGFTQKKSPNEMKSIDESVILLLQQSNQSQKKAIKTILRDKISVIEGPPGTGKTTTIINIIANLIYRNKKVLIVSKNNSAIDNVVEELDQMGLPKCYIRLGNNTIMGQLGKDINKKIEEYQLQMEKLKEENCDDEIENLKQLIILLNEKEEKLNELIKAKSELNELENQLRHVVKKNEAYDISSYEATLRRSYHRMQDINLIKNKIEYLAKMLIKISDSEKINLLEKILTHIKLNESINNLEEDGIKLHLVLEEKYLKKLIESKKRILENEDIDNLKKQIENAYLKEYIEYSKKITIQSILKSSNEEVVSKIKGQIDVDEEKSNLEEAEDKEEQAQAKIKRIKGDILELYPVIMTTVDAVVTNFYKYFQNGNKVDYVIIDEASQCDILSALPLLYIAKNIVVVGDCKQLSAIINLDSSKISNNVGKDYDYIKETFLSTISKVIKPEPNLLMEHYRCDYNIINYCNKYFYDNKLIIYKDAKEDAISIVNANKGKYETLENGKFVNYREIKTINDLIQENIEKKFIITPFRVQADNLVDKYNKNQCGTIHTFQGKGEDEVYFSTVLNDTEESRKHLKGKHNLFSRELINVAVSRAKNKFILVTDKEFFKKYDKNVRDLIEYIEVYGKEIPDKTVCIFDYLYKQIHSYQITDNCSNIYEKTLRDYLIKYIKSNKEYVIETKLPLATFITDKKFLDENPEVKQFILNKNTHTDFVIYKEKIHKPVLIIELDGKQHEKPIQKERDQKKDFALKHMRIKLWRIKSKETFTEEEFNNELNNRLKDEIEQSNSDYVKV